MDYSLQPISIAFSFSHQSLVQYLLCSLLLQSANNFQTSSQSCYFFFLQIHIVECKLIVFWAIFGTISGVKVSFEVTWRVWKGNFGLTKLVWWSLIIPFQALSVKIIMLIEISFYYTLVCVCEFPMFVDTKIEDYSEILNTW